MRQKQIASCFLGYLKDIYVKSVICTVKKNTRISKWIFLAYALFLRTFRDVNLEHKKALVDYIALIMMLLTSNTNGQITAVCTHKFCLSMVTSLFY